MPSQIGRQRTQAPVKLNTLTKVHRLETVKVRPFTSSVLIVPLKPLLSKVCWQKQTSISFTIRTSASAIKKGARKKNLGN